MCHTLKLVTLFPFSMIFEIMVYFTIDGVLGSTKCCISRSHAHHVKLRLPTHSPEDILQSQRSIAAMGAGVTKTRRDPNTAREIHDLPHSVSLELPMCKKKGWPMNYTLLENGILLPQEVTCSARSPALDAWDGDGNITVTVTRPNI